MSVTNAHMSYGTYLHMIEVVGKVIIIKAFINERIDKQAETFTTHYWRTAFCWTGSYSGACMGVNIAVRASA
ncbi:hypothetical protein VCR4J2_20012 [Vibrio coralliirubri]|nr:hypothetical protein VCR4J2_20012 [Vibrio coralliirubri]